MPTTSETRTLTIALPKNVVEEIESRVANGDYGSESELLEEGFHLLNQEAVAARRGMTVEAYETWLRAEILPALEEMDADPSNCLSIEQVRANLKGRHRQYMAVR